VDLFLYIFGYWGGGLRTPPHTPGLQYGRLIFFGAVSVQLVDF